MLVGVNVCVQDCKSAKIRISNRLIIFHCFKVTHGDTIDT